MIEKKYQPLIKDLCIRNVTQADLRALEWDGEFLHYRKIFHDAYLASQRGDAVMWMAEIPQARVIGQVFISLKSSRHELADGVQRAYLYGFRIRPAYRDHGIGTRIMRIVERDLINRGFRILTLNVSQDNLPALRFYKRLGFQILNSDPGHWSYIDHEGKRCSVVEPAWRMEKGLRQEYGYD